MPLSRVLSSIEREGVNLDIPFLKEMSKVLEVDSKAVQQKIYEAAGQEFNIASPKQLGEILFEKLKLDPNAKKTKTGQYMTGEEILSKMESEHAIASLILDFRELQKLKSTYVDALPELRTIYKNVFGSVKGMTTMDEAFDVACQTLHTIYQNIDTLTKGQSPDMDGDKLDGNGQEGQGQARRRCADRCADRRGDGASCR